MSSINKLFKNKIRVRILIFLIIYTLSPLPLFAAEDDADGTFSSGSGFDSFVYDIAVQSDGKIIAAGAFSNYNSASAPKVVRLNTNGTIDNTFSVGTGPNSTVFAVEIQDDGKILIGGSFTSYNGTTRNGVARLNTDGSLDTGFAPISGANGTVYDIEIQSDDQILISGGFSTYNGLSRTRIARVNTDGSHDSTFALTGTGFSETTIIHEMAIQSDGKIVVAGEFTVYNATTKNRVTRLNSDGSIDTDFIQSGTGFSSAAYALAIQSDGKIVVGGNFGSYNGSDRPKIARLNTNGTLDTGFTPGALGANGIVYSLAIQNDGNILAGGAFTTYGIYTRNRIVRVATDGSASTGFDSSVGPSATVEVVNLRPDGKILLGGQFTTYDGATHKRIVRLEGTPVDIVDPTLQTAAVTSTTLVLTYDEDLDEASVPATSDFIVSIDGATSTPTNVAVSSTTVTLTLSPAADFEDTVTVSYTAGVDPIQDEAGNDVDNLINQAVTNNTPDTTAPVLSTATASSTEMILTYGELLDEASVPSISDFSVSIDGATSSPTAIVVASTTVTLTLSPAVMYGDIVTISYTEGADPLQDEAGNDVSNLTNQAVTNNTSEVIEIEEVIVTPEPSQRIISSGSSGSYSNNTTNNSPQNNSNQTQSNSLTIPSITLRLGDTDHSVKTIQKLLNRFNFILSTEGPGSPGNETTYFGPLTEKSLKKLQRVFSLPEDGVYGGETKIFIGEIIQLLILIDEL